MTSQLQVQTEFEMIVGKYKIDQMKENWKKYMPIILGSSQDALLDKQFRNGPTYKLPGVFQIYEVLHVTIML